MKCVIELWVKFVKETFSCTCSTHGTPQSLSFVCTGKLASEGYARSALLPNYMADLSTSESEADDLAMCMQHFFSEGRLS